MLGSALLLASAVAACPILSEADLDAALAKRPKDCLTLRAAGGRTEARLNGQVIIPKIYKTSSATTDKVRALNREIVAEFGRHGFNLFTFSVDLAESADAEAPERIRRELREWLRRAPTAHILLNVSVKPWAGWGESHPSEVYRNEQGLYGLMSGCRITEFAAAPRTYSGTGKDRNLRFPAISYCSELFATAAAEKIGRIVSHLEANPEGKALVGAFFTGGCDGQWFDLHDIRAKDIGDKNLIKGLSADYSDAAREGFRRYLKKTYGTPEALAAAWGATNAVPFESVSVPSSADMWVARARFREHGRSPQGSYNRYMAWATAHFTDTLAKAVKAASKGRLIAGGYYKNAGLAGYPNISVAGTRYRFEPQDGYDFIATVPRYLREWNDPVVTTIYNGSMVRHGRLYVGELDLRNPEIKNWGLWGKPEWRNSHNAATFRNEVLKFAMAAVTSGGGYHAYDMNGGWYCTPAAKETWRVVNALADRAQALPLSRQSLAVVGGEDYFDYQSLGEQSGRLLAYTMRRDLQRTLGFCGVPSANYLVDEVLRDPQAELPALVIFNDLSGIAPAEFAELRKRYARDGRVLVYLWRPCTFREGAETVAQTFAAFGPMADIPGGSVCRGSSATEYRLDDPKALTTALVRRLAREAGFAPLVQTDEICYFGSGLFFLQAQTDGVKHFTLPKGYVPGETLYGPSFARENEGGSVDLKRAEIFVMTYRTALP
ncbi:MAG: beta-galactosidase [Kiritimatiellae bacterium]|nr:beta-galactosidase [Kiritimatiellia bacterium]